MIMYNQQFQKEDFFLYRSVDRYQNEKLSDNCGSHGSTRQLSLGKSWFTRGFSHTHTHALIKIPMIINLALVAAAHN